MLELAAVMATLLGAGALALAWLVVGRDRRGGPVWPRFEPPCGLSPAAVRFVHRQGFDRTCLGAAILSLAVKGAIRIELDRDGTSWGVPVAMLTPLGAGDRGLGDDEAAVYAAIFPLERRFELAPDDTTARYLNHAAHSLRDALRRAHEGATFRANRGAFAAALAAGALAAALLIGRAGAGDPLPVMLWGAAALAAGAAARTARAWVAAWPGLVAVALRIGQIAAILAIGAVLLVSFDLAEAVRAWMAGPGIATVAAAGAVLGLLAQATGQVMAAPTRAGQRLRDAVAGFRLYLKTAEERRIDRLIPPRLTPERFERLLPYAVALGLTQQWAAHFDDALATADVLGSQTGIGLAALNHVAVALAGFDGYADG